MRLFYLEENRRYIIDVVIQVYIIGTKIRDQIKKSAAQQHDLLVWNFSCCPRDCNKMK